MGLGLAYRFDQGWWQFETNALFIPHVHNLSEGACNTVAAAMDAGMFVKKLLAWLHCLKDLYSSIEVASVAYVRHRMEQALRQLIAAARSFLCSLRLL